MLHRRHAAVRLLAVLATAPGLAAEPGAVTLRDHLGAALDARGMVAVSNVRVELGPAEIVLEQGTLFPALPVAGRCFEAVFVGKGRFVFVPDDPLEASQLELFTDAAAMDEEVTRALLVFGDAERLRGLLERGGPSEPRADDRRIAAEMFSTWAGRDERRPFGADRALFGAIHGEPPRRSFAGARLHVERLGDVWFRFDPLAEEEVGLGRLELVEIEEDEQGKEPRRALRETEVWVSTGPHRSRAAGDWPFFEPARYTIDASLDPEEERIDGTARIELDIEAPGRRVVELELFDELEVERILDDDGTPLAWYRSGSRLDVVLAGPATPDERFSLQVDYHGEILHRILSGIYILRDTRAWHPHAGGIDRATYDVKLRWPSAYQLLAGGETVEAGGDAEQRWTHRRLPVRAIAFSFEVGEFHVVEDEVGHVKLTVGFSRLFGRPPPEVERQFMQVLEAALLFFETQFGWLDLDQLTVVTVQRGFSQGFLGLLTLSHELIWYGGDYATQLRLEVLAHELAHQWWGNQVGWVGYRDQWLSEALADFSALQFMSRIASSKPFYLAQHARGWRAALARQTPQGRTIESLGPVVLGTRLARNHGPGAYQAVVYSKGSVVFSMLARQIGEERLLRALGIVAQGVQHGVIDTERFLRRIGELSGEPLEDFAASFVYGTGIPEVFYEYRIVPGRTGGWAIEGTASRLSAAPFELSAVRAAEGWSLVRRRATAGDVPDLPTMHVPFQVVWRDDEAAAAERVASGLGGTLELNGELTRFSLPLDREPAEFWLDQRGEVLASFVNESRDPKRALRLRGERLAAAGELGEARAALQRAIASPVLAPGVPRGELEEQDLRNAARLEDLRIHLELARIHLEGRRAAEAEQELERVRDFLGPHDGRERRRRDVLQGRLDLLLGRYGAVCSRLGRYHVLRPGDAAMDRYRAQAWGRWLEEDAEAFVLLAIAAYEIGRDAQAREAMARAERLGADMRFLRELLEARGGPRRD
jgi:hypothetical protein